MVFMRRRRRMAENGAGVELRRAVRRHASLRRRRDNSRMSEDGLLQAMLLQLGCSLNRQVSEAERQQPSTLSVGKEAEVADADEAAWK